MLTITNDFKKEAIQLKEYATPVRAFALRPLKSANTADLMLIE